MRLTRWIVTAPTVMFAMGCGGDRAASLDTRTPVQLTAEQHHAVLMEMQTMLASVNGALAATARGDSVGVRAAATSSGMAAAADPALEQLLPAAWLQMATQTHQGFDSLAVVAGGGRDTVVARLGRVTNGCVSCHAMYRLTKR